MLEGLFPNAPEKLVAVLEVDERVQIVFGIGGSPSDWRLRNVISCLLILHRERPLLGERRDHDCKEIAFLAAAFLGP